MIIVILLFVLIIGGLLDLYFGYKTKHQSIPVFEPKTGRSDMECFMDGRPFFKALKEDIQQAKNHVHILFFIFRDDQLGKAFLKLLKEKAQSGVTVRLLVDAVGSRELPKKEIQKLEAAGVHFAWTAKPSFPFYFYHLNRRNHRKITVIDGTIGYFGGYNVGDEYLGKKAELGVWRDYHLRLIGENVHTLQEQFLNDWKRATKENIQQDGLFPSATTGSFDMTLVSTNGKHLEQPFIDHINKANKTLIIGSPYFIPSERLQEALLNRLDAGVKITILLPMKKDHPLVKPASYKYLKPLLEKGCRLFHFYEGFYHAKAFIIDDSSCYIGTANFDKRSLFWNDELSGFIEDPIFTQKVKEMVRLDLENRSTEMTLKDLNNRSWFEKVKTPLSSMFSPLL
ncbi:cardiolipin synthase [Scopulibacillus darangshiensis]|uniref:Cardiolipin synthase n=2 Tax=Scopulibacillus darangshiensis TaxID=442528 RepID=A0A4V2SLE0_9BACL|nr:cardiolipin synthase [Scopulibacillus darangshiensis]